MSVTSVQDLLNRPFKTFSKEEQLDIVIRGRFTELANLCQNDKGKYRSFATNWYHRVKWLTGNTVNKKLYCWSCVLFPTGISKIWNTTGFDDLKNLSQSIRKHEETKEHTYSTVKLKLFLKRKRPEKDAECDIQNNVKIKRNREYLERLIDVASALAHFGIPFRQEGHEGLYKYFLNIFKKYDDIVRTQIEECSPFKGVTTTIQIDLLESIAHAVKQKIVEEVAVANFFAVEVDEVTCSKESRQIAVSIRYVTNATPVERLIGLYDVSYSKKSEEIVAILEKALEIFNYKERMIAQCYDGGVVKSTELYNVQQGIKKLQGTQTRCPLVHCYAHDFGSIIAKSLRAIQPCKLFFSMVEMFRVFFRTNTFAQISPDLQSALTDSISSTIRTIHDSFDNILQVLEYVNTADIYDNYFDIMSQSVNLINHLKSFKFMMFVEMFQTILTVIESSIDHIAEKPLFSLRYRDEINALIDNLKSLKCETGFKNIISGVRSATGQQVIVSGMLDLYVQILDHIIYEIEGRFLDIESTEFCALVSLHVLPKESHTHTIVDNGDMATLRENQGKFFDLNRLKIELELLYSDPTIGGIGEADISKVSDILKYMYDHEISTCLPMLFKFLQFVVTIPSLAEPLEGSKRVLNRIKDYCASERNEEPRNALAFLAIEKDLFYDMEKSNNWHQKVIDYFASLPSTSSIDLVYKNTEEQALAKTETIAEPELNIKAELDVFYDKSF